MLSQLFDQMYTHDNYNTDNNTATFRVFAHQFP